MKTLSQNDLTEIDRLENELVRIRVQSFEAIFLIERLDLIYKKIGISPYLMDINSERTH